VAPNGPLAFEELATALDTDIEALEAVLTEAAANADGALQGTSGKKYRIVAGTIRNNGGTTWATINDAAHTPVGVTSITQTTTAVEINYAPATKIVTFMCGTDETYAMQGLRVGASVGLTKAVLSLSMTDPHRISDMLTWNGSSWDSFNGHFPGASFNGDGKLTLTHEAMGTALGGSVSARPVTGSSANTVAYLGAMGDTTTEIELRTPAGAKITNLANPTRIWVERAGHRQTAPSNPSIINDPSGNIWFIGVLEDAA
jgi:hypothetical protein